MSFLRKVWDRVDHFHLEIFLGAVALIAVSAVISAFVYQPAGILVVVGVAVIAFYWWSGFIDLVDLEDRSEDER